MSRDELDYGIEDFDSIGDRYIDAWDDYDDGYDEFFEDDPVDLVAIAYNYGDDE